MPDKNLIFTAMRAAMEGTTVEPPKAEEEMTALYKLAKRHDVAHLLAAALQGKLLQVDMTATLHRQYMTAIFRTEQLRAELEVITAAMEAEKIVFIPLKGSVLRDRYPDSWMRTSCDIDVLLHEEDLPRAVKTLCEQHGYVQTANSAYDVSLQAVGGVHVELHFDLAATGATPAARTVLSEAFAHATPAAEGSYCHLLSDEMFYFYHVAHMAKHFIKGGCGLRPFLDLTVLDGVQADLLARRNALLARGELLTFANTVRALAAYWFADGELPPHASEVEAFILSGGSYGTRKNALANSQAQQGSKLKFLCSRIFLRYDTIKYIYPVLQRHKWLTPFYEVRRWFALLFKKSARRHLKRTVTADSGELAARAAFLKNVGL